MSAWGPAVFSDDTAVDIKNDFIDLIGDGLSPEKATEKLLHEWEKSLRDPDEANVIWIALALTQWRIGRLQDKVSKEAISIIDSEIDLKRWHGTHRSKRKKILEETKTVLLSTQPNPKNIPKRHKQQCDWDVGEIIAYKTLSGKLVLLKLVSHHIDKGGKTPQFQLLDWVGEKVPFKWRIHRLKIKTHTLPKGGDIDGFSQFAISCDLPNGPPEDRIIRTHIKSKPSKNWGKIIPWYSWNTLDKQLKSDFGTL